MKLKLSKKKEDESKSLAGELKLNLDLPICSLDSFRFYSFFLYFRLFYFDVINSLGESVSYASISFMI